MLPATTLGDFVADLPRERLETDAAFVNGAAIRTSRTVPLGPLTARDVRGLLPFTDVVLKLGLRGRDLKAALAHGLAQTDREGGSFLQVSSARLMWDPLYRLRARRGIHRRVERAAGGADRHGRDGRIVSGRADDLRIGWVD
jgi:2',3'-cyclic-nucleotide 2'-phosphodiesterase (5'-nucleotidase family)